METDLQNDLNGIYNLYGKLKWREKTVINSRFAYMPIKIIDKLLPKRGKIIDLGCGHGAMTNYLALKNSERTITGIDLSASRIEIAEKSVGNRENIKYVVSDAVEYEFENAQGVLLCEILNILTFDKQKKLLEICYNGLSKDGVLIFKDVKKENSYRYYTIFIIELIVIIIQKCCLFLLRLLSKKLEKKFDEFFSLYFGKRTYQLKPNFSTKEKIEKMLSEIGFKYENITFQNKFFYPQIMYYCVKK